MHAANERLASIQALRAIAALAVVLGHTAQLEMRFLPDPVMGPAWLWGFAGVDLFFVISGFVMVHVTRQADHGNAATVGRFALSRVSRIYPPYWLFTVVALIGFLLVPGIANSQPDAPGLIRSFLLWPDSQPPFLLVGWTLVHEVYFYLVFGLCLFAPRRLLPVLIAGWMVAVVASRIAGASGLGPEIRLVTHPLTLEFGLGCAIAMFGLRLNRVAALGTVLAGLAGVALAIVIVPVAVPGDLPEGFARVLYQGVPSALIVLGIVNAERLGLFRPHRFTVMLGDWSYALYLSHLLILLGGIWLWARIAPDLGVFDNLVMIAGGVTACIAVAALAFYGFERPVLQLTKRLRDRAFPNGKERSATPDRDSRLW